MTALVYQNKDTLYINTPEQSLCLNKKLINYINHKREVGRYTVVVSISDSLFIFSDNETDKGYVPTEFLLKIIV
jgi:hypothetical protein